MTHIPQPWQSGSVELISHALTHLHRQTDFDRRIAFLLLDVGVETLFKTFLTAPEKETKALGKFQDRREAAEGNFYQLVLGVANAAGPRLTTFHLSHIHFYHMTRNKLYHDGVGISVPEADVKAYAKLAVDLLKMLLEVDLSDELNCPQIEAQLKSTQQQTDEAKKQELSQQIEAVSKSRQDLATISRVAIQQIDSRLALPSFDRQFYAVRNQLREANWDAARRIFTSDKFDAEFSEKLKTLLPMDSLPQDLIDSRLVSPSWDPAHLYLVILQDVIEDDQRDWLGMYDLSGLYPQVQQPELIYDTDYENLIDAGKQWVAHISAISRSIEIWLESVQPSWWRGHNLELSS